MSDLYDYPRQHIYKSHSDRRPIIFEHFHRPSDIVYHNGLNGWLISDMFHCVIRFFNPSTDTITTYAGITDNGWESLDGAVRESTFVAPNGLVVTPTNDVLVWDGPYVRRINVAKGMVTAVVVITNDETAVPNRISGFCINQKGTIFISDMHSNRIHQMTYHELDDFYKTMTIVGTGEGANIDGPALRSALHHPKGLCVDPCDNTIVWIACLDAIRYFDTANQWISTLQLSVPLNPTTVIATESDELIVSTDNLDCAVSVINVGSGKVESIGMRMSSTHIVLDKQRKRLLWSNAELNRFIEVTGDCLPVEWFASASVRENWRRVSILIAFLRANTTHPFRYSVLPLVSLVTSLL